MVVAEEATGDYRQAGGILLLIKVSCRVAVWLIVVAVAALVVAVVAVVQ